MMGVSEYKTMPQSIEAEEAILSGILFDNSTLLEVVDILLPQDFYRTSHQKIYSSVLDLYRSKEPVALPTLTNKLKEAGVLEECGGATYLVTLVSTVPLAVNPEHYAKIIKKASVGRQLIAAANEIAKSAYDPQLNILDVLDEAQTKIINIKAETGNDDFAWVQDLVIQRVEQYEKMAKQKGVLGIQTGFSDIDRLTGGFRGSKFIVIAARPRIGKSAIMLNMAAHMASAGHKVGIFSIEMDKEELIDRLVAAKSGVNSIKLLSGQGLSEENWGKINSAAEIIYSYPIVIDDTGGLKIQELKRRSRKMVKDGVEIVFIDQLSKIRGGKGRSEYEQRSSVVNEIAILKKELRVPICLLAQINRKLEDRTSKKPTLGDLKSTGSLEEDSDLILLGHRKYEYTKAEEDKHHAEWELAKHRQGATCNVEMYWNGKTVTFSEIERHY